MNKSVFVSLVLALFFIMGTIALAAETIVFEPVRAPGKGPVNAPVTIIEIADFM